MKNYSSDNKKTIKRMGLVLLLIASGVACGIGMDVKSWAIGLPGFLGISYAVIALIIDCAESDY